MPISTAPPERESRVFVFGALLGLSLLIVCAARVANDFLFTIRDDRILVTFLYANGIGQHLGRELVVFAAAQLGLHLALGLTAAALARLTEYAIGRVTGRRMLITGWFSLLSVWVFLANAIWFPGSTFVSPDSWLGTRILEVPLSSLVGTVVLALITYVTINGAVKAYRERWFAANPVAATLTLAAISAVAISGFAGAPPHVITASQARQDQPNVILIGIDSLRCDMTASASDSSLTPMVDEFLSGAQVFTDTTTPLARTFPAWTSILTGRHPVSTNTRFNLMPRSSIEIGDNLATTLAAQGYRTVYATDEVRFANIDGSFGFDMTITPPVGAADFLLGKANDIPLANLVSSTRLGQWLFPHTYANRAAHVTYRPGAFTDRLARELSTSDGQPLFAVIHLTLAHWPYNWADIDPWTTSNDLAVAYRRSLPVVDAQFGEVMSLLETRGYLDNAIVVLLSDHGEAIGGEGDSFFGRTKGQSWGAIWGHGTSVLSPHQFQVLLSFRAFGNTTILPGSARHPVPASLEDVRPTVLDLLSLPPGQSLDGLSLSNWLTEHDHSTWPADRIRFTETDVNTPSILRGEFDETGTLQEAAVFYELETNSGRVQLKSERIPELLANKERAAIGARYLLAALPPHETAFSGEARRSPRLVLVDKAKPWPMVIESRPDAAEKPEAAALWDALHDRFPGEL